MVKNQKLIKFKNIINGYVYVETIISSKIIYAI